MPTPRALHIIPYDGIGGVETAARSLPGGLYGDVRFEKYFLVRRADALDIAFEHQGPVGSEDRPRNYLRLLVHVLRTGPDLVIASLWRAAIGMLIVKLIRPRQRCVLFLHLAHDVHRVDRVANRLGMRVATEIWADSQATLDRRVPEGLRAKGRVISFVLDRAAAPEPRDPAPAFVFWGRLNAQKGLDRALGLFARIRAARPDATLRLIGPDGGEESALRGQAVDLGLEAAVTFEGPMTRDQLTRAATSAAFFLQTSRDEGMSVSVVEAMQAGLVPVVTPVGEIANYCRDGENAVVVTDDAAAADRVLALLDDPAAYRLMSQAAAAHWRDQPLYRDDVLAACRRILGAA